MTVAPGSTLGPYEIRSQLGQGGMGVVYLAQDPRLDRQVAIKVLPPDLTRDATAKQRFLEEAKATLGPRSRTPSWRPELAFESVAPACSAAAQSRRATSGATVL